MNSTEMKLKGFIEDDKYFVSNLYIENIDKVDFSINDIRIDGIGKDNLFITLDDMCLFSINDIPTKYYVLIREVSHRLHECEYYFGIEDKIMNNKNFAMFKPEVLSNIKIIEWYAKKYKYINEYKLILEDDLKSIFNRSIPNIEWSSNEMERIKQFLGCSNESAHGFSSFKYKAELVSLKYLKELINMLKPLDYNLEIHRSDKLSLSRL